MTEGHDDAVPTNALPEALVGQLWEDFRTKDSVPCPRDGARIALQVDGAAKSYRLVCTRCGLGSQWFEAAQSSVVVKGTVATVAPRPGILDD